MDFWFLEILAALAAGLRSCGKLASQDPPKKQKFKNIDSQNLGFWPKIKVLELGFLDFWFLVLLVALAVGLRNCGKPASQDPPKTKNPKTLNPQILVFGQKSRFWRLDFRILGFWCSWWPWRLAYAAAASQPAKIHQKPKIQKY